jgi:hypothetical protein
LGRAPIKPSSETARLRCGWSSSPQLPPRNRTRSSAEQVATPPISQYRKGAKCGQRRQGARWRDNSLTSARATRRGAEEGSGHVGGGAHAPMLRSPPLKHCASPFWEWTRRLRSRGGPSQPRTPIQERGLRDAAGGQAKGRRRFRGKGTAGCGGQIKWLGVCGGRGVRELPLA